MRICVYVKVILLLACVYYVMAKNSLDSLFSLYSIYK